LIADVHRGLREREEIEKSLTETLGRAWKVKSSLKKGAKRGRGNPAKSRRPKIIIPGIKKKVIKETVRSDFQDDLKPVGRRG